MTLKVSENGFRSMERKLESLKEDLRKTRIYKNQVAADNGNVWHDNNDFEQTEIEERRLLREISDLEAKIVSAEIISPGTSSLDTINSGAIVQLRISGEDFSDDLTVLFSDTDEKSEYMKISFNSPVSKAIYNQKIGFVGTYIADGEQLTVEVLDIKYES